MAALALLSLAPATASAQPINHQTHITSKCTTPSKVCAWVINSAQGSRFLVEVDIFLSDVPLGLCPTYRVLFNGVVHFHSKQCNAGNVPFYIDENLAPNTCVQGGVEGISPGRTPCWIAP